MKHPAIEQQPAPASGSGIPWSAEAEWELRRKIRNTWFEMWACLIGGLLSAVLYLSLHRWWIMTIAAILLGYGVGLLYGLALAREQLGEEMRRGPRGEFFEGSGMLANKPRSTRGLTEWRQHPAEEDAFFCECPVVPGGTIRRWHMWSREAQWIPNYRDDPVEQLLLNDEARNSKHEIDPGGGRYVILCPCGLGHFKLKQ